MLSKSRLSFIKSLHTKKYRSLNNLFLAEGNKIITELIFSHYTFETIYIRESYYPEIIMQCQSANKNIEINVVSANEMQKISLLQSPQDVMGIIRSPTKVDTLLNYPLIVCDSVQDPGNLGAILRIADWFGFKSIVLSPDCVEWQNPKVIQASMGSFIRIMPEVFDLIDFFTTNCATVYGAVLDGGKLNKTHFLPESVLFLGNEGHGIGKEFLKYIDVPVTISRIGKAESLNVAVAAGVICAEMQRNFL